MTPEEIDAAICEVRDWLDDYPEGTVIALFEARAWEVKGYADWDALCAAEFPRKVQLPRPERRELVGRFREAGMSTRAIASAVGVAKGTVDNDLSQLANSGQLPDRITGLDGKSRPATVAVDLSTGEVLGETVTAEVWEAEQALQSMFAADADIRAANIRRGGTRLAYELSRPWPDPGELAAIAPELVEELADLLDRLASAYRAAIPPRLHVIKEH